MLPQLPHDFNGSLVVPLDVAADDCGRGRISRDPMLIGSVGESSACVSRVTGNKAALSKYRADCPFSLPKSEKLNKSGMSMCMELGSTADFGMGRASRMPPYKFDPEEIVPVSPECGGKRNSAADIVTLAL